jgi:SAM-dependent methyltransferase
MFFTSTPKPFHTYFFNTSFFIFNFHMSQLREFVTPLHQATARKYIERMADDKVTCMLKAKEYEIDYWDGDRRYGYGGYKYLAGRWKPVAEAMIETYGLKAGSRVLDIGCGKGFLLYEMQLLEPGLEVCGIDISKHGLANLHPNLKGDFRQHNAKDPLPWGDKHFDLVITLNTLHNLRLFELKDALGEIERVGKQGYILVESYRNEQELFNLQCWALTCESFFDVDEWIWLYQHFGYTGDYEFIYF